MTCESMGRLFQNLTTVSLVAAVLAGSLLSPGVRHAHSQGDVPHSHDAAAVVSHEDHHGQAHDESHTHHGDHRHESDAPSGDLVGHWHISLLGIEFTFPQEDEPHEPLTQYQGELVVLRLTPDVVVNSAVALADLVNLSSDTASSADRIDVEGRWSANPLSRPVDRILLCDSARCERSGVLLI